MRTQDLRQELLRLKQEIAMRPIRVPTRGGGAAAKPIFIQMRDGNTLYTSPAWPSGVTTIRGLKYPVADVTSVPAASPAGYTGGLAPSGLSPAYIISESGALTDTVWSGYRLKPGADPALTGYGVSIPDTTVTLVSVIVQMPIAGTSPVEYAPVYLPWLI